MTNFEAEFAADARSKATIISGVPCSAAHQTHNKMLSIGRSASRLKQVLSSSFAVSSTAQAMARMTSTFAALTVIAALLVSTAAGEARVETMLVPKPVHRAASC